MITADMHPAVAIAQGNATVTDSAETYQGIQLAITWVLHTVDGFEYSDRSVGYEGGATSDVDIIGAVIGECVLTLAMCQKMVGPQCLKDAERRFADDRVSGMGADRGYRGVAA